MLAKDIMTKKVAFVTRDARVRDVARLLIEKSISAVPVLDEDLRPIGIVSVKEISLRQRNCTVISGPNGGLRSWRKASR